MVRRWVPLLLAILTPAQSVSQHANHPVNQSASQPAPLSRSRIVDYNSEELLIKIFEPITSRAAGYGLIKFGEQSQPSTGVTFEQAQAPKKLKFEDQVQDYPDQSSAYIGADGDLSSSQGQRVAFQDETNGPEKPQNSGQKKKRRRRRRKPRLQALGAQAAGFQGGYGLQDAAYAPGVAPYVGPGLPSQFHRPSSSGALESVMASLTAVARHDDLQCVPRLLCEALGGAASGATSGATSAVLRAITTIQPLLTMLGSLSGSPLAVFGRAALLGAGGPDACRPAYPACPADPQQLVHYLNNHNGGFFRFFNSPPAPPPGLNYGLHSSDPSDSGQNGFYKPEFSNPFQNYGFYQTDPALYPQPGDGATLSYLNSNQQYGYGYNFKEYRSENPKKHIENYGLNQLSYKTKGSKSSKIEKRILNRPFQDINEIDDPSKEPERNIRSDDRKAKQFKFPEEQWYQGNEKVQSNPGVARKFLFPGIQSNREVPTLTQVEKTPDAILSQEGVQVVYVVRGDGDPFHPEIVRL